MALVFCTNLTVLPILGDICSIIDGFVATDMCREGFLFHFPYFISKYELLLSSCLLSGGLLGCDTM
jgi:hypothetical protein